MVRITVLHKAAQVAVVSMLNLPLLDSATKLGKAMRQQPQWDLWQSALQVQATLWAIL